MKKKWKSFPPAKYRDLSREKLLLYSLFQLQAQNKTIKVEDLTACSFSLFPIKFRLKGYPKWPDSFLVHSYWRSSKSRGLIMGSGRNGFTLTEKGVNVVENVIPFLESDLKEKSDQLEYLKLDKRAKSKKLIDRMIKLPVYRRYYSDPETFFISEHELREILFATIDASYELLKMNLDEMRIYTSTISIPEIEEFLDVLEKELNSFKQKK